MTSSRLNDTGIQSIVDMSMEALCVVSIRVFKLVPFHNIGTVDLMSSYHIVCYQAFLAASCHTIRYTIMRLCYPMNAADYRAPKPEEAKAQLWCCAYRFWISWSSKFFDPTTYDMLFISLENMWSVFTMKTFKKRLRPSLRSASPRSFGSTEAAVHSTDLKMTLTLCCIRNIFTFTSSLLASFALVSCKHRRGVCLHGSVSRLHNRIRRFGVGQTGTDCLAKSRRSDR